MSETLEEVIKKENRYIRSHGGVWSLTEFDQGINDIQRDKITAFKKKYGKCYLGKVNYYSEERVNIDNIEILTEYTGQDIYNSEYAFCISIYDETLVELIRDYNHDNPKNVLNVVTHIFNRVDKLEGLVFVWR